MVIARVQLSKHYFAGSDLQALTTAVLGCSSSIARLHRYTTDEHCALHHYIASDRYHNATCILPRYSCYTHSKLYT